MGPVFARRFIGTQYPFIHLSSTMVEMSSHGPETLDSQHLKYYLTVCRKCLSDPAVVHLKKYRKYREAIITISPPQT
jgi:hypothetical protein